MKKSILIIIASMLCIHSFAQESIEKVMEKRAREMHRVISLGDKEQWKKFIKENYTQALIDKPMRAQVTTSENGTTTSSSPGADESDNLEAKTAIFKQLHADFGDSKIISIKPTGEKLELVVKAEDGLTGTFMLKFDKNKPYLIDGLGIQVEN